MKRNVKNLTLVTLLFILIVYVYTSLTNYLYEVKYSSLFKSQNSFNQKKLTLFSDCYCQKDLVHVEKFEYFYEITIEQSAKSKNQENYLNSYRLSTREFDQLFFTCDLYSVLRRGPFQRVLSYTLDENDNGYFFNNIEQKMNAANKHYPNWVLRFYHLNTISHSYKCETICKKHSINQDLYDNIDFCNVNKLPFNLLDTWDASYINKELWRLLPIADDFVNVFTSRSTDTCISNEQINRDLEWLKSNTLSQLIFNELNEEDATLVSLSGFKNMNNRSLARNLFSVLTDKYLNNNWYWTDHRMVFEQFILPVLDKNYSIQLPSNHKCIFK
jgi:hypothetical protein